MKCQLRGIIKAVRKLTTSRVALAGFFPTAVVYCTSPDFAVFIARLRCLQVSGPLLAYFILLALLPLAVMAGILTRTDLAGWGWAIRMAGSGLVVPSYFLSGACLFCGAVLAPGISNLADAGLVGMAVLASAAFGFGAAALDEILSRVAGMLA